MMRSTPRLAQISSAARTRASSPWVSLMTAMSIVSPRGVGAVCQRLHEGLDEEVIAPRDAFIDAKTLVQMIDAVQQDPLAVGLAFRQELRRAQAVEDAQGGTAIAAAVGRLVHEL